MAGLVLAIHAFPSGWAKAMGIAAGWPEEDQEELAELAREIEARRTLIVVGVFIFRIRERCLYILDPSSCRSVVVVDGISIFNT
jgi:hypothetical protein